MSQKTKSLTIWCDNGHFPVQMVYSHETVFENASIYLCSLCHAKKIVKESPLNNEIKIEWKEKPDYRN